MYAPTELCLVLFAESLHCWRVNILEIMADLTWPWGRSSSIPAQYPAAQWIWMLVDERQSGRCQHVSTCALCTRKAGSDEHDVIHHVCCPGIWAFLGVQFVEVPRYEHTAVHFEADTADAIK